MDSQGFRWIALDRSTPYGQQHDLLYIDSNGDGHLMTRRRIRVSEAISIVWPLTRFRSI